MLPSKRRRELQGQTSGDQESIDRKKIRRREATKPERSRDGGNPNEPGTDSTVQPVDPSSPPIQDNVGRQTTFGPENSTDSSFPMDWEPLAGTTTQSKERRSSLTIHQQSLKAIKANHLATRQQLGFCSNHPPKNPQNRFETSIMFNILFTANDSSSHNPERQGNGSPPAHMVEIGQRPGGSFSGCCSHWTFSPWQVLREIN